MEKEFRKDSRHILYVDDYVGSVLSCFASVHQK